MDVVGFLSSFFTATLFSIISSLTVMRFHVSLGCYKCHNHYKYWIFRALKKGIRCQNCNAWIYHPGEYLR